MINIKTKLSDSFMADLDKLTEACGEATLRATGYAGAKVLMDEAVLRVPVKTGTIRANIIIKRREEKSKGDETQTYIVTVRSGKFGSDGDAFYWKWVENGHKFVGRKAKNVSWKAHRAAAEKLEFGSSKMGAKPFLRPAFEAKKDQVIVVMRQKMAEKIKEFLGKP